MKFHGVSLEVHGIPGNIVEFHGNASHSSFQKIVRGIGMLFSLNHNVLRF